jgi:hypothetical protein
MNTHARTSSTFPAPFVLKGAAMLALVACSGGSTDDTSSTCEISTASISGIVYDQDGTTPRADTTVSATPESYYNSEDGEYDTATSSSSPIESTTTDSSGHFELVLEAGESWRVSAGFFEYYDTGWTGWGCYSETVEKALEPCDEITLELTVDDCQYED